MTNLTKLQELDKLKVDKHDDKQDKQAWSNIWNNTDSILDIIRTVVGIDKIYYDNKFKETESLIQELEYQNCEWKKFWTTLPDASEDADATWTWYEHNIKSNLNFLPKIANYNLKLVVEVVEAKYKNGFVIDHVPYKYSSTEPGVLRLLEAALDTIDWDSVNRKALDFAISYIQNPNLRNKKIQDLQNRYQAYLKKWPVQSRKIIDLR
tara:strand:+ start:578 stop:1201 length:624 start_codon:yes stop_codon:yes gene_type:complete